MRRRAQSGLMLVEVMIALAILALGLVFLLHGVAGSLASTQSQQMQTAVTELARGKMYDIEELLYQDGFQQLDKTIDGDFEEEGWPHVTWEADIQKIELPNLEAMQAAGQDAEGQEGEESQEAGGSTAGGGLLGMAGGFGFGQDMGGTLISSQFELFRNVLEESIRKVVLTVRYKVAGKEKELLVECYFTDPAAVNRVINFGGASPEAEDGDEGGSGGQAGSGGQGGSTGRTPTPVTTPRSGGGGRTP